MYFLASGAAGYVLPFMNNIVYIEVDTGDDFGTADLIELSQEKDLPIEEIIKGNGTAKRTFTVFALTNCELLSLTLEILHKMAKEFYNHFESLFDRGDTKLRRLRLQQLKAIRRCSCESHIERYNSNINKDKYPNHLKNIDSSIREQLQLKKNKHLCIQPHILFFNESVSLQVLFSHDFNEEKLLENKKCASSLSHDDDSSFKSDSSFPSSLDSIIESTLHEEDENSNASDLSEKRKL